MSHEITGDVLLFKQWIEKNNLLVEAVARAADVSPTSIWTMFRRNHAGREVWGKIYGVTGLDFSVVPDPNKFLRKKSKKKVAVKPVEVQPEYTPKNAREMTLMEKIMLELHPKASFRGNNYFYDGRPIDPKSLARMANHIRAERGEEPFAYPGL